MTLPIGCENFRSLLTALTCCGNPKRGILRDPTNHQSRHALPRLSALVIVGHHCLTNSPFPFSPPPPHYTHLRSLNVSD